VLGIGSILVGGVGGIGGSIVCFVGWRKNIPRLKRIVHWYLVILFPFWLAWFFVCAVYMIRHRTEGFRFVSRHSCVRAHARRFAHDSLCAVHRRFGFLSSASFSKLYDPSDFSFLHAAVFVNFLLDIPCFAAILVLDSATDVAKRYVIARTRARALRGLR
jgi:hypothetical protein